MTCIACSSLTSFRNRVFKKAQVFHKVCFYGFKNCSKYHWCNPSCPSLRVTVCCNNNTQCFECSDYTECIGCHKYFNKMFYCDACKYYLCIQCMKQDLTLNKLYFLALPKDLIHYITLFTGKCKLTSHETRGICQKCLRITKGIRRFCKLHSKPNNILAAVS